MNQSKAPITTNYMKSPNQLYALICIFTSLTLPISLAQATETTLGQWSGFFSQARVNESWGWYLETQTRLHEGYKAGDTPNPLEVRNNRFLLRPALVYYPFKSSSLQLHFGYGWTPNLSPKKDEHRIYQQILYQAKTQNEIWWSVRARLEQRDIEFSEETAWRFRFFSRISQSVTPIWGWVVWEELFWNLNDVALGPSSGFDQNRIFVGPKIKISDLVRLEIGYIHNYFGRSHNTPENVGHVLAINAFFNWN